MSKQQSGRISQTNFVSIIAVHGLGPPAKGEAKHAFDTWRTPSGQKGRLWLQQDLPDHTPNSRIFLYQYNTTAAYGQGHDGFHSKADNLLEAINIERRDCPDRPILLLGHSIGGLLVKQALINAHSNPGYSAIKDATTTIVFFGTPHELVTQKLGDIGAAIAIELGHETQGDLVVSLQTSSTFSELESWKHQALEYDTISFWGSTDTMVSRNSVNHGLPGDIAKIVELDTNHRGICKFSNSDKDQYNLKIVVENIKHLYELAIEKTESQYGGNPDTSDVETPRTSGYGHDEHDDILEEIQRVALSTTNDTERPVMTPSQESQLQDYEAVTQECVKTSFGHSAAKDVSDPPVLDMQDSKITEIQGMLSETQDKLYSRIPFELLNLPEPVLKGIRSLNYQKPTNVQEAVLSALMRHPNPPRNVIARYPPGTGRTTALAIALLSRTPNFSTTQPQVLVIVPTRLLVSQTEKYIKEMGRFCQGLVTETITASNKPTRKVEANVIIATPGSLLDCICRWLVDTSLVRFLLMDDIDYLVDSQGLSDRCIRVARRLPETTQFLLFSDLSTQASVFLNTMLPPNTYEKHELRSAELQAYKIVHLFFRCSGDAGKQEKLDIICNLPGIVAITTLIIFVERSPDAQRIHHLLATQGYAVANLFDAADNVEVEEILDNFKAGQAKVLITKDCKTRGLDLPSSSMVINYDVPDADAHRYLRQVSRAGKAGRFGFAVNLVSNEKEKEDLQSVATSEGFDLRELPTDDWDAVENFLRGCTKSQWF
ncbi:NB-ARC domain-containing protein [Fusarium pseudoanthophilum]|uniref:ATP-dependent RNA helicase n=1 Tax=Fusarium pseudoanthophilum TaxID=48495 RepID=A0A8H5PRC5_9HYPO|nr:NB-ARC domain-containing protein [Fusarium pseudoanthophilum]